MYPNVQGIVKEVALPLQKLFNNNFMMKQFNFDIKHYSPSLMVKFHNNQPENYIAISSRTILQSVKRWTVLIFYGKRRRYTTSLLYPDFRKLLKLGALLRLSDGIVGWRHLVVFSVKRMYFPIWVGGADDTIDLPCWRPAKAIITSCCP